MVTNIKLTVKEFFFIIIIFFFWGGGGGGVGGGGGGGYFLTGVKQPNQHYLSYVGLVSLPNYHFPGQAKSSKQSTITCAHSFKR